jgi:hypothetical protein
MREAATPDWTDYRSHASAVQANRSAERLTDFEVLAQSKLAGPGEDLFVGTYSQSYRANVKNGLNVTHSPHHAVQDAVSSTSHGRGITINLRKDIHALTRTFRKPLAVGLSRRQQLALDVIDLRRLLVRAGYDYAIILRQLRELIRQNKAVGEFGR